MKRSTAGLLASPWTGRPFELIELLADADRVLYGCLVDADSGQRFPICAGFPLFPEALPADAACELPTLKALEARRFGAPETVERFVETKWRRPAWDPYAISQPFSEATRALEPLLTPIRETLRPGDLILDTWCRTGFSGELLAALFPEQQVLSLWESRADILGYRGFRHWLSERERASNLDVVFHSPADGLPLRSGAAALVHGFDTLHRYAHEDFVPEALRVAREDGVLVFPHVHLTNAEPDPWFDRGCIQRHGTWYRDHFAKCLEGSRRRAFVLSEKGLFEGEYAALVDDPETAHYNALVLVADRALEGRSLAPSAPTSDAAARVVVNGLLDVDLAQGRVRLDEDALEGGVGALLDRHPLYRAHLAARAPGPLGPLECQILFLGDRGLSAREIAARLGRDPAEVLHCLRALEARDVLRALPISEAMARLQHYYASQRAEPARKEQTLAALWTHTCARNAERVYLRSPGDEDTFSYADAAHVVEQLGAKLDAIGVGAGDRVCVWSEPHAEAVFAFWATVSRGAVFVPVDRAWPVALLRDVLERMRPRVLFVDEADPALLACAPCPVVVLDPADPATEAAPSAPWLSDWLEPDADAPRPAVPISEADTAVVLHTSGTTGAPKAVALSHGALFRSGRLLAGFYGWRADDVVMSLGGFHAMSGLRNPILATAACGASALLPGPDERAHVLGAALAIGEHTVSVLTVRASFLQRAVEFEQRLPPGAFATLRLALSTAGPLRAAVKSDFECLAGATVCDYYGLTETCGACILAGPEDGDTIGRPIEAIVRILGGAGEPVPAGVAGELVVFSENLMQGYVGEPHETAEMLRDGWLHTGDIALRRPDGSVELVGRGREIVKTRDGDLVQPAALRALICEDGRVADAIVVGSPDARGGERLVAFVEAAHPLDDEPALIDAIRAHARDRLGPGHVPQRVVLLDALPRGADGEVEKARLQADYGFDGG